ncbi:MAG: ATP synthase F1 subunit delta [Deltaproteobacteria bacterium]|nr:ATP synthase F1 subunit delta [Candidatus Zymogenaceae bacterium]
MIHETIAKKYARALFELALEDKQYERCGREIESFAVLIKENEQLWGLFTGPAGDTELRRSALDAVFLKTKYLPLVDNFIRLSMDKERLVLIGDISRAYGRLLDEHEGKMKARLVSAAALSDEEIAEIKKRLSVSLKREIILETSVDPSLIGGAVAYVGGLIFDGSIKTQLTTIRDNLKKGHMS